MNFRSDAASELRFGKQSTETQVRYFLPGSMLLIAMYTAGLIGLQTTALKPLFQSLVPFNLIASACILLFFHRKWTPGFFAFCLITFLSGYWIEVAGVHTGLIFGSYQYGQTLGWQWLGVPLLIGVNWLTLIYSTGVISRRLALPWWGQAIVGALLMVLLDFFIEPIAVEFDFWSWQYGHIPLQNFLAWFIISFALLSLFHRIKMDKKNPIAFLFYTVQLLFFILQNVGHYLNNPPLD